LQDQSTKNLEIFLSRESRVLAAYLFGSYARGEQTVESDIDVAILLSEVPEKMLEYYSQLAEEMSTALGAVSLAILNEGPPLLKHEVVKHGKLIYCRDEKARMDFEAKAEEEYRDFLRLWWKHGASRSIEFPGWLRIKILDAVLKLRPNALEYMPRNEIEAIVDKFLQGSSQYGYQLALNQPDLFCEKCGKCCRECDPILLNVDDLKRLASHLGPRLEEFIELDGFYRFKKTQPCAFLKDNQCSIYEYRPARCREVPFIKVGGHINLVWDEDLFQEGREYCKFAYNLTLYQIIHL